MVYLKRIPPLLAVFLFIGVFFSCNNDVDLDDFLDLQRDMIPVGTGAELEAAIQTAPSGSIIGIVGNIVLANSLTIDKNLTITGFSGKTTISPGSLPDTHTFFYVTNGASLTLGDVRSRGTLVLDGKKGVATRQAPIIHAGDGTPCRLTMNAGVVLSNNSNSGYGGGVSVNTGSSFVMFGGTISGNSAASLGGGGVYLMNGSSFTMFGGAISGNFANTTGGGVYAATGTSFAMFGGAISGNTASDGGGVYFAGTTFTMTGGNISYNTSSTGMGGGVLVGNGTSGTFNMSGGFISGNTATRGGGVCVNTGGTFNMSGGTISGNTASANTFGGGGVYIAANFTKTGGTIYGGPGTGTANNAASGNGHAVFRTGGGSPYRNTTAGEGDTVDTATDTDTQGNGFWLP